MSIYDISLDIIKNKILQFSSLVDLISLKLTCKHFNEKININKIFNKIISSLLDIRILNLINEHNVAMSGLPILELLLNENQKIQHTKNFWIYEQVKNFPENTYMSPFVSALNKMFPCTIGTVSKLGEVKCVFKNINIIIHYVGVDPLIFVNKVFGTDLMKVSYRNNKIHLKSLTKLILRGDFLVPEPILEQNVYKTGFDQPPQIIINHRKEIEGNIKIIAQMGASLSFHDRYNEIFDEMLDPFRKHQTDNILFYFETPTWDEDLRNTITAVLNSSCCEGTNKYLKTFPFDLSRKKLK